MTRWRGRGQSSWRRMRSSRVGEESTDHSADGAMQSVKQFWRIPLVTFQMVN